MAKVYEIITNRILDQLEKGVIPWKKPWKSQMPKNLVTKKEYRGINVLMLSFSDYDSPYWLTFKQCKDRKCHVKKGEKGLPVVYWNWIKVKDNDDDMEKIIPLMRYYTVFNVRQCEGIDIPDDKQIDFRICNEITFTFQEDSGCIA